MAKSLMIHQTTAKLILKITNAVKGTFREKLNRKLEIEPLSLRYWLRRICAFCKIKTRLGYT